MKSRQIVFSLLALSMVGALVACSSSSNSGGGGGGGGNPISVALSGTPPATLAAGAKAQFTATVTNDSTNSGVTWSATCPTSGGCGSFSPTASGSGVATTYTAPAAPPSGGTVTITATSVTDGTKKATATVTITNPLADGSYVFQMSGSDTTLVGGTFNSPYFVAGMFTVSGGVITGGEQDFVDYNTVATDLIDPTASSITVAPSGNLQIALATCAGNTCPGPDNSVGVAGVETINIAMVSPTHGRIVEFDTFATSSGTLDLQDATAIGALPSGGYAFAVQGVDIGGNTIAIGGILDMDGNGAITSSSVFDQNRGGNLNPGETFDTTASTITGPDASGRIVISLKPTTTTLPVIKFAGYIVDSTHIRLAEVVDPSSSTMGGVALGQGANVAVSGNTYVVGVTGFDGNGALTETLALSFAQGANGATGNITYNDLTAVQPSTAISGATYVADANGRVTVTGVTAGNPAHTFDYQLYVDGNGNALAISMDASDVVQGYGYQATASPTVSGTYVMAAAGFDFNNEQEFDDVGAIATASGTFASASSGVDSNWLNDGITPLPASVTVNGTFTSNGTGSGNTITGLDIVTPTAADSFDYYVADSSKIIGIENDGNQLTLIYFEQ